MLETIIIAADAIESPNQVQVEQSLSPCPATTIHSLEEPLLISLI